MLPQEMTSGRFRKMSSTCRAMWSVSERTMPSGSVILTMASGMSCLGMNSVPRNGVHTMAATNRRNATPTVSLRRFTALSSSEAYRVRIQPVHPPDSIRLYTLFSFLKMVAAIAGTMVTAMNREAISDTHTVSESGRASLPAMLWERLMGRKTATVVSVPL